MTITVLCLILAGIFLFFILGFFMWSVEKNKENRISTNSDIATHKELVLKIAEADFVYQKALAELNVLKAKEDQLRLSINNKMDNMGFLSRIMMPFS